MQVELAAQVNFFSAYLIQSLNSVWLSNWNHSPHICAPSFHTEKPISGTVIHPTESPALKLLKSKIFWSSTAHTLHEISYSIKTKITKESKKEQLKCAWLAWWLLLKKKCFWEICFKKSDFREKEKKLLFEVILRGKKLFFLGVILSFFGTQKKFVHLNLIKFWTLHRWLKMKNDKYHSSISVLKSYFPQNKESSEKLYVSMSVSTIVFFFSKKLFLRMYIKHFSFCSCSKKKKEKRKKSKKKQVLET